MAKLDLDKYYTDAELAKKCIDITLSLIPTPTEIIEPSAGSGGFSLQIPGCKAYDIEPEHESVIKQDFIELDLHHREGRLFIGNPPFGYSNNLAIAFFKKACACGDYVAFILPITCLGGSRAMYEFDLIHSEDLGLCDYSGRKIRCCFNVYRRPKGWNPNTKPDSKIRGVDIYMYSRSSGEHSRFGQFLNSDFRICAWGSCGKEVDFPGQYSKEMVFYIHPKFKDRVIEALRRADWEKEFTKVTNALSLEPFKVQKYLRRECDFLK